MTQMFYINEFEGPLDLLLHLIKTSKMDIYEINTKEIIDQYLEYIHKAENMNIDIASEYLVMAAELIHLKSKLLVNDNDEEESESEYNFNSEEDLKKKLAEYDKYKNVTEEFKLLEQKRSEIYTKYPEKLQDYIDNSPIKFGELSILDLMEAFQKFKERQLKEKPLNTKITKKEISISERVKKINELLSKNNKIIFTDLFEEINNEYVIATFLAILQMSKNNEIIITQENNFQPIIIEKRV